MFNVGDIICYPMHGVGKIESIEKKEVLGNENEYYTLYFFFDGIQITVPTEKAIGIGLRNLIEPDKISQLLNQLKQQPEKEDSNWNKRYRTNLEKMRTGNVFLVAQVAKTLYTRNKVKNLSAGEKKMLDNAKQFIIGEISYASNENEESTSILIEECLES